MSMVALALLIAMAVATATFYVAGGYGQGSPWARDVCNLSRDLCHNPMWLLLATGGMAGIYLVLRSFRL